MGNHEKKVTMDVANIGKHAIILERPGYIDIILKSMGEPTRYCLLRPILLPQLLG